MTDPLNFRPRGDVWDVLKEKLDIDESATIPAVVAQRQVGWNSNDLLAPCGDGFRTAHLLGLAGTYFSRGFNLGQVVELCLLWNQRNTPPLDEAKVISTCTSVGASDARKHPDRAAKLALVPSASTGPMTPLFDVQSTRIDRYLSSPPPLTRWLLKDFMPLGIVAGIVSPGGMGKSQLLMQLGYSITTGIDFCGHWKVGEVGSVLMICAEDDDAEVHRRLARIHAQLGQGMPAAMLAGLYDRFHIKPMVGEDVQFTSVGSGVEAVKTEIAARFELTAQQFADLKLIILDPGSRFRGGDENSNAQATRFVQVLEQLRAVTGATVLIAHHSSKAGALSGSDASQFDSRGASAFTDGIRLQMSLSALPSKKRKEVPEPEDRNYLVLSVVKTNYTRPQAPVTLHREQDGFLLAKSSQLSSAQPAATAGALRLKVQLLTIIRDSKQKLTAKKIEETCCVSGFGPGITQRRCRELIAEAVSDGLIALQPRKPLMLTSSGSDLVALQSPASGAAGTARQHRAHRKSP